MEPTTDTLATPVDAAHRDDTTFEADAPLVEDELLVEEISIDGMCGVY